MELQGVPASVSTIDLTSLKRGFDTVAFRHCYERLMPQGAPITVVVANNGFLLRLFAAHRQVPFRLLDVVVAGNLWSITLAKVPEDRTEVLVIPRYTCPGPIVEILALLRRLEEDQALKLVFCAEKFDREALHRRLMARGYEITEWQRFPLNTFVVHIVPQAPAGAVA